MLSLISSQMKPLNLIHLFIACLSIISCQQKDKKEAFLTENIKIDFSAAAFDNYTQLNIVDTTLIIPLSEDINSDLIIGQLDKIVISDSLIYIADTYLKRLLIYDMQGNIIGKVGTAGGGPGEYTSLSDFCVGSNGEIYLYDSAGNKMLVYDSNLQFVKDYDISFKAEQFQLVGDNFLFGLAPYNIDQTTSGKMVVLTNPSFTPIFSTLKYDDNIDHNYEFFSPMTLSKEGNVVYNRVIDNNVYLFDKEGGIKTVFRFDFGEWSIDNEELKNINALLESNKNYCYVASSPVLVDDLLMGILNKSGEMFTFVYDSNTKKLSLNALKDYSVGKINLPITIDANGSQLVSYFNKDIYPEFDKSDNLSSDLKAKIEQGIFVLCISKIAEKCTYSK